MLNSRFINFSIICLKLQQSLIKKVYTEGRLIVEFGFDDLMRIRTWHFAVRSHRELVPRSILAMQEPGVPVETLSKNVTRQGLTSTTLNYLRVIIKLLQLFYIDYNNYSLFPCIAVCHIRTYAGINVSSQSLFSKSERLSQNNIISKMAKIRGTAR